MKENAIRAELGDLRLSVHLFDEAFLLGTAQNRSDTLAPAHRHADYELFLISEGKLTVRGGGQSVTAEANSALILPPLFEHTTQTEGLRGYCIYFTPEQRSRTPDTKYRQITEALKDRITLLPLTETGDFYIRRLAKTALSPAGTGEEEHLTALLFSELLRPLLPPQPPAHDGKNRRYINVIDHFIAEHYREKIRLSDLAETLYLCPKQVTRIIRKKYGCSFSDLVHSQRMALARAMLESTEESISTIAQAVGYEYENYFYALFRKYCGTTPLEYRRQHQKKQKQNHTPEPQVH